MTPRLLQAAADLADALGAENAALAALDIRRATALLPRKHAALQGLAAVQRESARPEPALAARTRALAARLNEAAAQNRGLLERAIEVQGRVIATLVRAVPAALPVQRYGASGARAWRATPVSLSARA